MFEKYTEKARRTIFFARYEASELGSAAIEAEHLLLGLLREDKQLAETFKEPLATAEALRQEIRVRSPMRDRVPQSADMPLSRSAQEALKHAADESQRLGHAHIGTEHLILGILHDDSSLAAQFLRDRGLSLSQLRDVVQKDESQRMETADAQSLSSDRLLSLIRVLMQRGVIDVHDHRRGSSPADVTLQALVDLLASKGVISEDEKAEILGPEKGL